MKERCFIVEGKKNVLEAINSSLRIRYVLATSQFIIKNKDSLQNVVELIEVDANTLTNLGTYQTNEDCMAVIEMPEVALSAINYKRHIVALDGVSDPGNLGTIIRTLDWFGVQHLICSLDCADVYNPKVINATMGSFSRVNVHYTDLASFIAKAPSTAYGADLQGISSYEWKPTNPTILVMGSESHGISGDVKNKLLGLVTIPQKGQAESLNVAIATGILCHQLFVNS